MCDKFYFKVQYTLDIDDDYWRDYDEVFSSLPDAEEFASSIASRSLFTSARVVRFEESILNEYYCNTHRNILDFK